MDTVPPAANVPVSTKVSKWASEKSFTFTFYVVFCILFLIIGMLLTVYENISGC